MHSTLLFFFFNDTATTEIYTLSLHDALPIYYHGPQCGCGKRGCIETMAAGPAIARSEEHTSELQSQSNIVCRLLLEKKKDRPILSSKAPVAAPARRNLTNELLGVAIEDIMFA